MPKSLKANLSKYFLLILLSELLIIPLIISLFLNLQPVIIYFSIISAFLLFFLPGFAATSFLKNINLFERLVISLVFGLAVTSTIIFLLSKFGAPINNVIALIPTLLSVPVILANRKNFYFNNIPKGQNKVLIDVYDLLAAFIAILAFSMLTIPISLYPTPYGGLDGSWHYFMSNYIRENNKLPGIIPEFSHIFAGERYSYPPVGHINIALFGSLLNIPQIYAPYNYSALLHMLLGLGIYVLVKRYFGKVEAIGAMSFTLVSKRVLTSLIEGQWPFYTGLVMLPISVFLILNFYKERTAKNAIFLGLLFGLEVYTHPLIAVHSILIFIIYGVFWGLVNKKIPRNLYLIPILFLIAIPALFSPQTFDVRKFSLSANFHFWYPTGEYVDNYFASWPKYWYNFFLAHNFILYFAAAGIVSWLIFFRKDYLLITLFISLFLIFHLPLNENILVRFLINEFILISILAGLSFSLLKLFLKGGHRTFIPIAAIIIIAAFLYMNLSSFVQHWDLFRIPEDDFKLLKSMKNLPDGKTSYIGRYEFSYLTSWAPFLSEHAIYYLDVGDSNNTITLNFQDETKYVILSTSYLSPRSKNFIYNFNDILMGQGCKVIKSYPTAILLSFGCLASNKVTLMYKST